MPEMNILSYIIALTTFAIAIGAPILKLNATITKNSTIIKQQTEVLAEQTKTNKFMMERLGNHEVRITVLETRDNPKQEVS